MMPFIKAYKTNGSPTEHNVIISHIVSIEVWNDECRLWCSNDVIYSYYGTKEALYAEISRAIHRQNFDKGFQDLVDS